ncbi:exodeoxyribonuclease VII, small subunit [Segniliparus rotundus DSM 44985]|uniref:Exodeoxyribonuclease 7 small subunit n=1 Tax=Segniliparus rotundus (strain ATCC BAA-972 / CDC 1076 / CIP 108378 / DSM 44985 / JCM 13578) TaxID=640132 RepID=D6ZF36_SEGRD|nr:exodeoxyribonuclease VII small subunit [Segniliparus rotundus]ADG97560.1 exodeoxyribonuclease VII, small subunit [Segniliparus rotundus DSM 44985]
MTETRPTQELGYEEAREELVDVVRQLEQGGLSLDVSVALWERGEALVKRCEEHLDGASKRVEAVLNEAEEAAADPESEEPHH